MRAQATADDCGDDCGERATGTVTNSASVVSDLPDPNMANNTGDD